MKLQLITPEKIFFEGEIVQAQIPGALGEFGVLPGHAPFISILREGVVTIDLVSGGSKKISVTDGVAEVTPERCIVLVDSAAEVAA